MNAIYLFSEPVLFLVCLALAFGIALIGMGIILVFRRGPARRRPSLLPGPFITAIVFPAAVVVGLLVNDTWRRYMDAQDVVQQEALAVRTLLMESAHLPQAQASALSKVLKADLRAQIESDRALFQQGEPPAPDAALQDAWQLLQGWLADPALQTQVSSFQLERLKAQVLELQKLRDRRILLSLGKMDGPKWWVMFCLLLTCSLAMSEITLHVRSALWTITALFVLGNGALLYMLNTHERPFVGGTGISLQPVLKALQHAGPAPAVVTTPVSRTPSSGASP